MSPSLACVGLTHTEVQGNIAPNDHFRSCSAVRSQPRRVVSSRRVRAGVVDETVSFSRESDMTGFLPGAPARAWFVCDSPPSHRHDRVKSWTAWVHDLRLKSVRAQFQLRGCRRFAARPLRFRSCPPPKQSLPKDLLFLAGSSRPQMMMGYQYSPSFLSRPAQASSAKPQRPLGPQVATP